MASNINSELNAIADPDMDLPACKSKVERLSNCIEIANLINSELSIGKLLSSVMATTKKAFAADAASLLLLDEKTGDLTFQIAMGDVGDEIKELFRLEKGEGIGGEVAETGRSLNLQDAYDHPKFSPDYDEKTHYRTRSMLCVPLKIRGDVIGVIQVINKLLPPYFFTEEEVEMLETIAGSAAVAIDTARMHKVLMERQTLERDLKLAREVQESFLPESLPEIAGIRFGALMQPALEIGGDFYNLFTLPDQKVGIVVGDVSGKGISASLFMARLCSDLQHFALLHRQPARLLTRINQVLCKRAKRGMFVTVVYLMLDLRQKQLWIANAGHLSPVVSNSDGSRVVDDSDIKGPPLGILPDIEYQQYPYDLTSRSSVTLYTDGVIEARNSKNELFGVDNLLQAIGPNHCKPDTIINSIIQSVDRFSETEGRSDDLTLFTFCLE